MEPQECQWFNMHCYTIRTICFIR